MKKFASLFLVLVFLFSSSTFTVQASGTAINRVDSIEPTITIIDESQIPEGVIPLEFESEEELNAYIEELGKQIANMTTSEPVPINPRGRATTGTAYIASQNFGLGANVSLYVSYMTSLNNNLGAIVFADPFTSFTGYTFGFVWNQSSIGSYITSNGKNVYAYANGVVDQYLTITGGGGFGSIKIASYSCNLSGYAYLVH